MEKQTFEPLEIEIIELEQNEIIITSGGDDGDWTP